MVEIDPVSEQTPFQLWKKAPESGLADEPNTRDYLVVVGTPDQPEKAFRLSSLGCDELANLVTAVHQDGYAYHDGETNEILKWILVVGHFYKFLDFPQMIWLSLYRTLSSYTSYFQLIFLG